MVPWWQRESGEQLTNQEWNICVDNAYLSSLCSGGVFNSFKCLPFCFLATLYVNKYLCALKGAFSFFSIRGRKAGGSFKADSLMKQNQE